MDDSQKIYEISFWMRNEADKEYILKTIQKHGGSAIEEASIFKSRLAYPIQKEIAAFFDTIIFALPEAESVKEMLDEFKTHQNILRFLICKNRQVPKSLLLENLSADTPIR